MRNGYFTTRFWPTRYWSDWWPAWGRRIYTPMIRELGADEFINIGKFAVESWDYSARLSLRLRDWKTRLQIQAPTSYYTLAGYPDMDPDKYDTPVPILFGKGYGLPVVQIDTTTKTFKVAAHALASFDGFFADGSPITPNSFNLSTATFIWTGYGADENNPTPTVTVDATGLSGNPADVIEELLTTFGGEPASQLLTPADELDANYRKGFGAYGSRLSWVYGATAEGVEGHCPDIALYVSEPTSILELIGQVCEAAFGRFFYHPDGFYYLDAWEPVRGEDVELTFGDHEVFELRPSVTTSEVLTALTVKYRADVAGNLTQNYRLESTERRLRRGLTAHKEIEKALPIWRERDAHWWASRVLAMEGQPLRTFEATVTQKGWLCLPGTAIRLTYSKRAVDGIFEVLAVKATPGKKSVDLLLGDFRGLRERPGHWTSDTPTFPASLGGGSAAPWDAGWTAAQKRWARENLGFWQDDDGFNDGKDAESYKGSVWA